MNAKVTLKEKIEIIRMLNEHFTIGEGAENLINALTSACSEKEKDEEQANLVLFAFATIAKPLIDDVPIEPLQKMLTKKDDEPFPSEEKIIIKNLANKVYLIQTVKKVCDISLRDAVTKVAIIVNKYDTGTKSYTFNPFFIGNRSKYIFTIKQWKEICVAMSKLDNTFDWETLNIKNVV